MRTLVKIVLPLLLCITVAYADIPKNIQKICGKWYPPCPPIVVCPEPPVCPIEKTRPIDIRSVFSPTYTLSTPFDTVLADMAAYRAAGIDSIVITVLQDSGDLEYFIKVARIMNLKIILTTAMYGPDWAARVTSLANDYAKYNPDGWYINSEFGIDYPASCTQTNGIWSCHEIYTEYTEVIKALRSIRDIPLYISPYLIQPSDDDTVRHYFDEFVSHVSTATQGQMVISALQDGVGCDYNKPSRRVVGGPVHDDFLRKAKIHKEVCEKYGWSATINIELFDTYTMGNTSSTDNPSTASRVAGQLDSEGKSDYVSKGIGLGPCFDGTGVLPRPFGSAWYPYHTEVYDMILKRFIGWVNGT
jgi:hypothetical protein